MVTTHALPVHSDLECGAAVMPACFTPKQRLEQSPSSIPPALLRAKLGLLQSLAPSTMRGLWPAGFYSRADSLDRYAPALKSSAPPHAKFRMVIPAQRSAASAGVQPWMTHKSLLAVMTQEHQR